MVFKIVTDNIDSTVSCNFIKSFRLREGDLGTNLGRSMFTATQLSFLLIIEQSQSGIVCQIMLFLHAVLVFLKQKTVGVF